MSDELICSAIVCLVMLIFAIWLNTPSGKRWNRML